MEPNLSNLPGDIQRLIARQGVTSQLRRSSSTLQQRVEPIFRSQIEQRCDQYPSNAEIKRFYDQNRQTVLITDEPLKFNQRGEVRYLIANPVSPKTYSVNEVIRAYETVDGTIYTSVAGVSIVPASNAGITQTSIKPSGDLNAMYQIYRNRFPCETRFQGKAKELTLKYLDYLYEEYQKYSDETLSVLKFYAYLIANAITLNISKVEPRSFEILMGPDDHRVSTSRNPSVKLLTLELGRLYKIIRGKIQSFP